MNINVLKLGRVDYGEALGLQERLFLLRQQGKTSDTLILLEHPPVITLGRRGNRENILVPEESLNARGVKVYEVSRGGDVTYHGPGQLVGYPIMDLTGYGRDIKQFIWNIEEVFIRLLAECYGIEARREEGRYAGVWVGDEKITAIGVAVKKWVTMHGFAFNVNTSLEHFNWINPCGLTDRGVTSLEKILGQKLDMESIKDQLVEYFCMVFRVRPQYASQDGIEAGS